MDEWTTGTIEKLSDRVIALEKIVTEQKYDILSLRLQVDTIEGWLEGDNK